MSVHEFLIRPSDANPDRPHAEFSVDTETLEFTLSGKLTAPVASGSGNLLVGNVQSAYLKDANGEDVMVTIAGQRGRIRPAFLVHFDGEVTTPAQMARKAQKTAERAIAKAQAAQAEANRLASLAKVK